MGEVKSNERYGLVIYALLVSMFDEDSENHEFNLVEIDATEFFTGLVKASSLLFNKLTEERKSTLEFTYLANNLIVQNLLQQKKD